MISFMCKVKPNPWFTCNKAIGFTKLCTRYTVLQNVKHYTSERKLNWRILFYGSDEFAATTLKMLNENRIKNNLVSYLEVVNKNNAPTPVKSYASKNEIANNIWPYKIPENTFDLGVVVSFGKLIPENVISSFPYGMINIHPSLLPRWRGPAPIIHTILNGDKETALTIIKIAPKKFDVGKILVQHKIQVPERITSDQLSEILANLGAKVLEESLGNFETLINNAIPQAKDGVTQAPKPKKEMAIVDWNLHTSYRIDCLYRAIGNIFGIQTNFHGIIVKLSDIVDPNDVDSAKIDTLLSSKLVVKPGSAFYHKKRKYLCVKCSDKWLAFKTMFVTGKPKMTAQSFASGYLNKVDNELRYFG